MPKKRGKGGQLMIVTVTPFVHGQTEFKVQLTRAGINMKRSVGKSSRLVIRRKQEIEADQPVLICPCLKVDEEGDPTFHLGELMWREAPAQFAGELEGADGKVLAKLFIHLASAPEETSWVEMLAAPTRQ